jgi:selenocysteine lyase/cysteine desulfurase
VAQMHSAMETIKRSERVLSERLLAGLATLPGMRIYGLTDPSQFDRRVPTVSFTFDGHDPMDVARELGTRGIFSWAGDHYALEPLAQLGLTATGRVGLVHYNLPEEIDRFIGALVEIVGS